MSLPPQDRLTLALLYRILEKVNDDGENYAAAYKALEGGYSFDYPLDQGVVSLNEERSPEECKEVWDILTMFDHLQGVLKRTPDTTGLNVDGLMFSGFDGNHDWQYGYQRYIMKTLDKFTYLCREPLNSHSSVLPRYRRMLAAWRRLTDKYAYDLEQITREDLIQFQNDIKMS